MLRLQYFLPSTSFSPTRVTFRAFALSPKKRVFKGGISQESPGLIALAGNSINATNTSKGRNDKLCFSSELAASAFRKRLFSSRLHPVMLSVFETGST